MIDHAELERLATTREKVTAETIDACLAELRARDGGILQAIRYLMWNRRCGLQEASDLVINSPVWADQREDFLREQEEAFWEYVASNNDRIEAIQVTMTPEGTKAVARLKSPDSGG